MPLQFVAQGPMLLPAAGGPTSPFIINTPVSGATFTVPAGVTSLTCEAWGAGAGGGGASAGNQAGGGGGGYSLRVLTVTPGGSVFYTVGSGGAGNVGNNIAGGDSWVNGTSNAAPTGTQGCLGGGAPSQFKGIGSLGTTNFNGGDSGNGGAGVGTGGSGGAGSASDGGSTVTNIAGTGGTPDGGAGGNGKDVGNGDPGTQPGGGGGGTDDGPSIGGNGANGRVRFIW